MRQIVAVKLQPPQIFTQQSREKTFLFTLKNISKLFSMGTCKTKKNQVLNREIYNMSIFEVEWLIKQSEQPDVLEVQKELKQQ